MDKIKTLSQAIRFGSKLLPQAKGCTFDKDDEEKSVISSCALGAAFHAFHPVDFDLKTVDFFVIVKFLEVRVNLDLTLSDAIIKRNDKLGHSREQIADWLEEQGM